ncbi:MAG: hypothetical protein INH41_27025 [Myxococcaceae bacterium]|jgi:hypothetical protein|nr:hypothetical protein [Myxococcaceae bacterium]
MTYFQFDSVTELVRTVRTRHPGAEVWTGNENSEFLLRVRSPSFEFQTLIVHFEGAACYAVELPSV